MMPTKQGGLKRRKDMKAKDVLVYSLRDLKREDIIPTSLITLNGTTPTSEQQEVVSDLMSSLNDTIMSISYIYLPLKTSENITVENGKFLYQNLSKTLIDVLRLKDIYGINHKFSTFPTYLKCESGRYEIIYTYQPELITQISQDIDLSKNKLSERVIATGCTANFYLKRGMYEDSNCWEKIFERQIMLGKNPKYIPELSYRRWI